MENIVVFGAGGHAKVVIDVIEKQANFKIVCVYDGNPDKKEILGYPIIHDFTEIKKLNLKHGIIAVGHNWTRLKIAEQITSIITDFRFIIAVHPKATIARNVTIGEGTVIMAGSCINTDTKIGIHCIINTSSSIDHENIIENFSNVSPGVITGGNVKIGEYSFIGLGSNIIQKSSIGVHTIIGAGSLIVKNIPDKVLAYGSPCVVKRPISIGENLV